MDRQQCIDTVAQQFPVLRDLSPSSQIKTTNLTKYVTTTIYNYRQHS